MRLVIFSALYTASSFSTKLYNFPSSRRSVKARVRCMRALTVCSMADRAAPYSSKEHPCRVEIEKGVVNPLFPAFLARESWESEADPNDCGHDPEDVFNNGDNVTDSGSGFASCASAGDRHDPCLEALFSDTPSAALCTLIDTAPHCLYSGEVQDRLIRNCVQPQHSDAESASVCDLLLRHCRSTSEHDVQTSERSDGPARIPMSHFAVWQALRCSCLQGKKRTFETLCALGVDVQAADAAAQQQQKGSLVHAAAVGGSQSIIQRLLDDYHLSPEGLTTNSNHNEPVHLAAAHGRTHALLQLINRGVSIDTRDRHGRTPLFHAAVNGHLSTVKALTESGARIQVTDYDGISLIEEATRRARIRDGQGRQALAEYLQHMLQQRKEEDGACS